MAYRNQNYEVTFESPLNISHKYTAQGMSQGFQMGGGPWGMLIGTIIGNATGGIMGRVQTRETWKQFKSMLRAADSQNKATIQELSRNLSEVSRQRAVLSMETQSALAYTQAQATKANAEAQNVLAAADQVGSAVDYVKSQVALEESQQNWMTRFNYETQQWNLNVQAQNLINAADAQFVGVNVNKPKFNWGEAINDMMQAGTAMASTALSKSKSAPEKKPGTPSNYIQKTNYTWTGKTNWGVGKGGLTMNGKFGNMNPQISGMLGL